MGSWEVGCGLSLPSGTWGIQVGLKEQATDLVYSWVAASQSCLDVWRVQARCLMPSLPSCLTYLPYTLALYLPYPPTLLVAIYLLGLWRAKAGSVEFWLCPLLQVFLTILAFLKPEGRAKPMVLLASSQGRW